MELSDMKCKNCNKRLLVLNKNIRKRPTYDGDTGMIIVDGFDKEFTLYCPRCDIVSKARIQTKI